MARAALLHRIASAEDGARLDAIVGDWLAREFGHPLSKSAVRRLIMAGAIRLDGRPNRRPGVPVRLGDTLEARIDRAKLESASPSPGRAQPPPPTILYEDDDVVAVAKPAGLLMHATADARRADLFNAVRRLLAARSRTADLPYLGLHHRLDIETSGVVLFARHPRANEALATQFAQGEVTKIYHALVAGRGADRRGAPRRGTWHVDDHLALTGTGRHARMQRAGTGGAHAVTDFAILEALRGALLVEARPHTGRKHQIRAHLAGSGMPVLGDTRYDGAARAGACAAPRVMLHAHELSLRHPVTGRALTITCAYPADFARMLECLRRR